MKIILLVLGLILSGISITLNVLSLQQTNFTWAAHLSTAGFITAIMGVMLLANYKFYGRKE